MSIVAYCRDILAANIMALLDKAEDPEKMVEYQMRRIETDMRKVMAETAGIMAKANVASEKVEVLEKKVKEYDEYVKRAEAAENYHDANVFNGEKMLVEEELGLAKQQEVEAKENAEIVMGAYEKLVSDYKYLKLRKDAIKSMMRSAKTEKSIGEISGRISGIYSSSSDFDRWEEKAKYTRERNKAMNELSYVVNSAEALKKKYGPIHSVRDEEKVDFTGPLVAQG